MRKITGGVFQSLDGVIQAPGGPKEDPTKGFKMGGWSFNYWDAMMGDAMGNVFSSPFDLLLGRKTYEIFAAHWPFMTDDPTGKLFDRVNKYVVTSSTQPLSWQNSHILNGDIRAEISALKASEGPDLVVQGSSELYPILFNNRLLDQLFVLTFPVVLDGGKKLFAPGLSPFAMKLVDHKVSTTGVILSTYEPSGDISLGTFERSEPSKPEVARQKRMKVED